MRRRSFIGTLGRGAVAAGLAPTLGGCDAESREGDASAAADAGPEAGTATPAPFRAWTWVHGGGDRSPDEWAARFARIREAGMSGVLVSGGDTGVLSEAARSQGLEFHRWIWTLNRSGDAWVRENHPEWFTVSRNGESSLEHPPYVDYYRWVCPTREPVRAYLAGVVDEIAADERVDGVHLDYVRHCDVILPRGLWEKYDLVQDEELPQFDFCYCEACRVVFEEQTGRDPLELEDAPSDEEWRHFRWDSVTGCVEALAEAVHARGKPITAAVFPSPGVARTLVRQAWDQWPVDAVFPMLYHGFYLEDIPWIGARIREAREAGAGLGTLAGSDGAAPPDGLYAGLYLPDLDPAALAEAVGVAREAGAAGVSTFEMGGLSDRHLEALGSALPPP